MVLSISVCLDVGEPNLSYVVVIRYYLLPSWESKSKTKVSYWDEVISVRAVVFLKKGSEGLVRTIVAAESHHFQGQCPLWVKHRRPRHPHPVLSHAL
jgi:hypothetical protein